MGVDTTTACGVPSDAAVVFSGDCDTGLWRMRLAIASLARLRVPRSQVFVLTSGDWTDDYIAAHATRVDVSGVVSGTLGIHERRWHEKWGLGMAFKLTVPVVPELSGFSKVLSMDPDVLVHNARVSQLLAYPCHGYEVVGGAFYRYGTASSSVGLSLSEHRQRILQSVLSAAEYEEMYRKLLAYNPLECRVWVCDGVSIWDLDRLRADIPWYLRRVSWWYQSVSRAFPLGTEDFVATFLDTAPLLPQHLVMHLGGTMPSLDRGCRPAVVHYGADGCRGGPCSGGMVSAARELGLDAAAFERC